MANKKLSDKKLNQMWVAFQEKQSDRYIARVCHVAKNTARKYRIKLGWDTRFNRIKKQAEQKSDSKAAKIMAESMTIITATIRLFTASLTGIAKARCPKCDTTVNVPVPKLKPKNTRDIVALLECRQKLLETGEEKDGAPKRVKYSLLPPLDEAEK